MNKAEIDMELGYIHTLLSYAKDGLDTTNLLATYVRHRMNCDRTWRKLNYKVANNNVKIINSPNKGEVHIGG